MRTIPQRALRDDIARVLREVEAGARFRVTVDGRPVADLVRIQSTNRTFVQRGAVIELLQRAPLDAACMRDIEAATGASIDEL
ncbi:MAG: type II toxin-antitoxin system Phd/YefM family antitoxin [Dehalococcoidia bacterium]